jgi:hypothetical protein
MTKHIIFVIYCQDKKVGCPIFNGLKDVIWCVHPYFWATHSRLEPVKEAAYTIKRHWDGVLRWFTSKINNGILEGINSLIQAAKARARGYRTTKNLITMIYLIGGKLEFKLPT